MERKSALIIMFLPRRVPGASGASSAATTIDQAQGFTRFAANDAQYR
jgi:hypothetical protein